MYFIHKAVGYRFCIVSEAPPQKLFDLTAVTGNALQFFTYSVGYFSDAILNYFYFNNFVDHRQSQDNQIYIITSHVDYVLELTLDPLF